MAEELVMNVKSNLKSVTQETQQLNNTLDEQKRFLIELQKEELKLQRERSKQSAYEQGLSGINDKIKRINNSIKDQKLDLKGLTQEQSIANKKLKEFNKTQKEQEKAVKGTIGNFQVMGVSLNGLKRTVSGIIPLIKMMFKSITAGIMSTGLGVFVIAFGSLVTYVTSTKEGMDKLAVTMAKIGAGFNVVKDRISGFGKIVKNIFNKKISETINDVKDNFAGMGKEIKEETKQAGELEKATQKLRDTETKFLVTRAKKNKQLAEARLLSEDENTSLEDRRVALANAIKLEKELLQFELNNQAEKVRILKEQTEMANSTAADEKALADARVVLIDMETKSLKTQKRLKREMNSLDNEIAQEKKDRDAQAQKDIDDAFDQMIIDNDAWNEEQQRIRLEGLAAEEAVEEAKKKIRQSNIDNIASGIGLLKGLAGENKALQAGAIVAENALGIARTIISTQASNATTIAEGAALAIPTGGASVAAASALVASNNVAAGISIAASAAATAQGLSKLGKGGGGGGGGQAPTTSGGGGAPSPQMMSGSFELGAGVEPEPVQAFVLTDEMTNSQNQLANIRRRATI